MRKVRMAGAMSAVTGVLATLVVLLTAAPASAATVERVAGTDRYDTAAKLSAAVFTPDTSTVYVATGGSFADALAAGPAAGKKHAPILLVTPDSVPAPTKTELQRLTPSEIVIVGGSTAVSTAVETELKGITANVRRLAGATRYETAKAISADSFGTGVPAAFVASGTTFPDALGGGAAGGAIGGPILLTEAGAVPSATAAELDRLDPASIVVLGGTSAVNGNVASSLGSYGPVRRVAGPDRFATSAGISRDAFKTTAPAVILATGLQFPDALAGSAAAAQLGGPLLLVNRDCVSRSVNADIDRLKPSKILLLGGTNAATDAVVARNTCPDVGAKVLGKDISKAAEAPSSSWSNAGVTINGQNFASSMNTAIVCTTCNGSFETVKSVEFDLGGAYASLTTTVGMRSDSAQSDDAYRFEIILDGNPAFSKEITGLQSSEAVSLNVVGVARVKFQITRLLAPAQSWAAFGSPTVYTS